MESKIALITGITGQDGSYLAELLLKKGYEVYGTIRRQSTRIMPRISHIADDINLLEADITDKSSLDSAIIMSKPDEVYNLAAQSFVGISWIQPILTTNTTAMGVINILESIRHNKPDIRLYQASSSEMFGYTKESPQNENTPFYPRSPYGIAKLFGYWSCINYRESYGMHVSNGILFNHESPRRGLEFVTRKITYEAARIYHGLSNKLALGNISSMRDWGFAGDYVGAMWDMLQQDDPSDYVIATSVSHSVMDFLEETFDILGLDVSEHLETDENLIRPADVIDLKGDYSKANSILGWSPTVTFKELVKIMVDSDVNLLEGDI